MNHELKAALEKGLVEMVFTSDGSPFIVDDIPYYQASDDGISMLMGRFMQFTDMLRKHDELKLSDEVLTAAITTMRTQLRTALSQHSVDPEQSMDNIRYCLATIERIEQRRSLGLDISQVYDIAAIWFFSEEEDPATVDMSKQRKKVAGWMKHPELLPFFLKTPIGKWVRLDRLSDPDTLSYMKNLNMEELLDLKLTYLRFQTSGATDATTSTIGSRVATLLDLDGLYDQQLRSTTTT